MSDSDSDIEVLTTKPSTSLVPATRVNTNKGKQRAEVLSILSSEDDDALPDIAPPTRKHTAMPAKKAMSSKAAAMLAKIGEATRSDPESEDDSGIKLLDRSGSSSSAEQPKAKPSKRNREVSDNEDDVLPNVGAGRKSKTASLEENEAPKPKPAAKKARTSSNAQTKEEKAQAKALAREEAERQKQANKDFKEDNKLAGSRKETLCQLTVEISQGLAEDDWFSSKVLPKLKAKLAFKDVDEDEGSARPAPAKLITFSSNSDILSDAKVMRWRRTTHKYWDDKGAQWLRYDDGIRKYLEEHLLLFVRADELQEIIAQGDSALLDYISQIKEAAGCVSPPWQIYLMIEGLNDLGKAGRNAANRAWQARANGDVDAKRKKAASAVDMDEIEMEVARLEVVERAFTIRTSGDKDTANWLFEMSCDISNRPYKLIANSYLHKLDIDGDSNGKGSKKGDHKSSYMAGLNSIFRVDEGVARSIVKAYPTWRKLYEAYEACASDKLRQNMLIGLKKNTKANGGTTNLLVGAGLSKRIYLQLYETDIWMDLEKMM